MSNVINLDSNFFSIFEKSHLSDWQGKTRKRLDELLSERDLRKLLGRELQHLFRSILRRVYKIENISKDDMIKALIFIYGKDLFINKEIGQKFREIIARRLKIYSPKRFIPGKNCAIKFVTDGGFPVELAGEPSSKGRDPFIVLDGQLRLPDLKDFQKEIKEQIFDFLNNRTFDIEDQTRIVSLPTGSGKTRITIQAVHQWIKYIEDRKQDPRFCNLIIWVAQTDELCEQAFQEFYEMWKARPHAKKIKLARMWGGFCRGDNMLTVAKSIESLSHPIVIISTNQTLHRLIQTVTLKQENNQKDKYIAKTIIEHIDLLIIDEAHHAVASTYQRILEEIYLFQYKKATENKCKALGLTATPFRSEEEGIERLERIFKKMIFPTQTLLKHTSRKNSVALKELLQGKNILSKEEYIYWDTKLKFVLKDHETKDIDKIYGEKIDNAPTRHQRRAFVSDRIYRILRDEKDALILFFGVTVNDAKLMTCLLRAKGIEVGLVTGDTNASVRENIIQDFKKGKIRVLCNCRVLTTGFDAPKVTHVVMGWQTYSPVLFIQMVGRGLRGTEFGGTESCKIIQVRDEIEGTIKRPAIEDYLRLWPKSVFDKSA